MEKYLKTAKQFYGLLQRVNYGAEYFKNTSSRDTTVEAAYVSFLNNLSSAFDNFVKVKKEKNLNVHDFREVLDIPGSNGKFVIHKGRVYGDLKKAEDWADAKLKEADPQKDNYLYELSLYISLCVSNKKVKFIEIPEVIAVKIKKPEVEIIFEAEAESNQSKVVSILDMFTF